MPRSTLADLPSGRKRKSSKMKPKAKRSRTMIVPVTTLFRSAPLGLSRTAKLYYNETVAFSTAALGACSVKVFSCNSLYDPNVTGGGHQPMGFDQLITLFNRYTVVRANIEVEFVSSTGSNSQVVGICQLADASTVTNPQIYGENQPNKMRILPPNGSQSKVTLSVPFDASKWSSKTDVKDNYELSGTVSTSPSDQAYWHIYTSDPVNFTGSLGSYVNIKIVYDAVFWDPAQQTLS